MTVNDLLGFADFADEVADRLGLDATQLEPTTHLTDDLGLESFELLEIIVMVEELGVPVPDSVAANVQTLGDLYEHYRSGAASG